MIGKKVQLLERLIFEIGTVCENYSTTLEAHGAIFEQELQDQIYAVKYLGGKWIPVTDQEKEAVNGLLLDLALPENLEDKHNLFDNLEFGIDEMLAWATYYRTKCLKITSTITNFQRKTRGELYRPGKPLYEK